MTPTRLRWRHCATISKPGGQTRSPAIQDELGEREEPATADVEGLRRFLEGTVLDKLSALDATRSTDEFGCEIFTVPFASVLGKLH
jgi:hypothetical protein